MYSINWDYENGPKVLNRQLDFSQFYLPLHAPSLLFKPGWKFSTSVHGEFCGKEVFGIYSLRTLPLRTRERDSWILQLFTQQFWKIILNLHYRPNKFKFWMRINWHGGLRFWRNWKKQRQSPCDPPTQSPICCLFPAISLPFVL